MSAATPTGLSVVTASIDSVIRQSGPRRCVNTDEGLDPEPSEEERDP